MERIDKILAHLGFGSRKDVKKLLHSGAVTVNGAVVSSADFHIDSDNDKIAVAGEVLEIKKNIYLMMNKCACVVCSAKDGAHRTVFDCVPPEFMAGEYGKKIHTVGRLDIDTEGLLILTTDGELTHRLTSPKNHVSKKYLARLRDKVAPEFQRAIASAFASGIEVPYEGSEDAFTAKPAALDWLSDTESYLTISEGKYHQVKRMFAAVGNEVVYLKRVAIGSLILDESISLGECRELTTEELAQL